VEEDGKGTDDEAEDVEGCDLGLMSDGLPFASVTSNVVDPFWCTL